MLEKDLLTKYNGDVYLYYGDVTREAYHQLSDVLEASASKKEKGCLILITYGGDPDAGYRIARAMNHHYTEVEILIPDICKSAGTLLCIGAKKLIFGDRGELGPLDIQISKPDELFENMSGLDIIQALNALQNQVLYAFRRYLMDIRGGSKLRTKLAADIAAKLADGFISPIAAKVDPITLGEHHRAMQIAFDYGERLSAMSSSLESGGLVELVSGFPSHGFVIDRKEAATIFKNVAAPDDTTIGLYEWARMMLKVTTYPDETLIADFKDLADLELDGSEMENNCGENKNSGDERSTEERASLNGQAEQQCSEN